MTITAKPFFNGSGLGVPYAATGLLQRLQQENDNKRDQKNILQQKETIANKEHNLINHEQENELSQSTPSILNPLKETAQQLLDILTKEEYTGTLSAELQNDLKRRKRKKLRPQ